MVYHILCFWRNRYVSKGRTHILDTTTRVTISTNMIHYKKIRYKSSKRDLTLKVFLLHWFSFSLYLIWSSFNGFNLSATNAYYVDDTRIKRIKLYIWCLWWVFQPLGRRHCFFSTKGIHSMPYLGQFIGTFGFLIFCNFLLHFVSQLFFIQTTPVSRWVLGRPNSRLAYQIIRLVFVEILNDMIYHKPFLNRL